MGASPRNKRGLCSNPNQYSMNHQHMFILAVALLSVHAYALPSTDDVVPEHIVPADEALLETSVEGVSWSEYENVRCGIGCPDNSANINDGNYHMKGTIAECKALCAEHEICGG